MKVLKRTSKMASAANPRKLSVRSRRLTALCIAAAAIVVVVLSLGASGGGSYKVRAIFVNSAGITNGADVRVAGANVGSIDGIYAGKDGLASVILDIKDPGYQQFYADAHCRIRLQSLIGEKFVDCTPGTPSKGNLQTDPADDSREILPHSQTGSPVDPDELLDAMREPQRERFRVIINELGITLTGRGQDLQDILDRFNPTLMNVNKILKILADENKKLVQMAEDGDESLERLARARKSIVGLMKNADIAARATNQKQAELAETLQRLPEFLRELEQTAPVLEEFANQAAPVAASARAASGDLSDFVSGTKAFVDAANPALTRFGQTADVFRAQIPALQPVAETLKQIGDNRSSVTNIKKLLTSFDQQNGYPNLAAMAIGLAGAGNGTNAFGHFMRSSMVIRQRGCLFTWQHVGRLCSDWTAGRKNSDPSNGRFDPQATGYDRQLHGERRRSTT
ncbi:MAG: MlaD family protein [Solirubrobacterales bacterium]